MLFVRWVLNIGVYIYYVGQGHGSEQFNAHLGCCALYCVMVVAVPAGYAHFACRLYCRMSFGCC